MIAKLVVEGKEFDIEILDPKLQELIAPKKKTGYERVDKNKYYCIVNDGSELTFLEECEDEEDDIFYTSANYYESEFVAAQNARADTLMRQLRRFAVEHRVKKIDWKDIFSSQFGIYYMHNEKDNGLYVSVRQCTQDFGGIYFDSKKTAELAISTFYNELIWYFTEYKDSL